MTVFEVITIAWYFDAVGVLRECFATVLNGVVVGAVTLDGEPVRVPLDRVLIERPE